MLRLTVAPCFALCDAGAMFDDPGFHVVVWLVGLGAMLLGINATVRHYTDPIEVHPLAHMVTVLALACATSAVLLLPLDVASISPSVIGIGGDHPPHWVHNLVERAYVSLDHAMVLLGLGVLPFSFFFVAPEHDLDVSNPRGTLPKALSALRSTAIVAALIGLLMGAGVFLHTAVPLHAARRSRPERSAAGLASAVSPLLTGLHGATSPVRLAVCTIGCLGAIAWLLFASYGIAIAPLALLTSRDRAGAPGDSASSGASEEGSPFDSFADEQWSRTGQHASLGRRYAAGVRSRGAAAAPFFTRSDHLNALSARVRSLVCMRWLLTRCGCMRRVAGWAAACCSSSLLVSLVAGSREQPPPSYFY